MRVYIVVCNNEYAENTIEFVCDNKILAEQVKNLMQSAADDGTPPLQEWFYGRYSIQEYNVSSKLKNLKTTNVLMDNFDSSLMPGRWKNLLKPLEGVK